MGWCVWGGALKEEVEVNVTIGGLMRAEGRGEQDRVSSISVFALHDTGGDPVGFVIRLWLSLSTIDRGCYGTTPQGLMEL